MCIKNTLQITEIIKEYCVLHFVALFLALKKSATWAVSS